MHTNQLLQWRYLLLFFLVQQNWLYSRRSIGMMIFRWPVHSAPFTVTHRHIDSYFSFFVHLIILNDMRLHRPWMRSRMFAFTICFLSVSFLASSIVLTLMPLFAPYKCGATVQSKAHASRVRLVFRLKEEMKNKIFHSICFCFGSDAVSVGQC